MDASSLLVLGVELGALVATMVASAPPSDLYDVDVRRLADAWKSARVSPVDPRTLKHSELKGLIQSLVSRHPGLLRAGKAGVSVEGREIFLVSAGSGPDHILLWSQMHGNEPTATSSLIDMMSYMGSCQREPWVARILQKYTLLYLPMLNPDGAERGSRRNTQGLDINRDARALQTPEGRLLKDVRDRYRPFLGFNLHNQSVLTTVGDTGHQATIALLAVASDRLRGTNGNASGDEGFHLTRRVASVLHDAMSPFAHGHISRYDEQFNPRAFGDNMTLWGTPTVLIETGGQAPELPGDFAVMLNFIGICAALDSLASGKIANASPAVYDSLKANCDIPIFDLLLQNAWIFSGSGVPLFRGDVAVRRDLRSGSRSESIISDIGDLGVFTAHQTLDCSGSLLTPGLIGWDPRGTLRAQQEDDLPYLMSGFTTVLQTVHWNRAAIPAPSASDLVTRSGAVNWGFVLMGPRPRSSRDQTQIAQWLAAGGRAWIGEPRSARQPGFPAVALCYSTPSLTYRAASRYKIPRTIKGSPGVVLPRWTSEAAGVFRIPRRGVIAPGAIADLVLWTGDGTGHPAELGSLRPSKVILNGRLLDPDRPEAAGSYLGE